MFNSQGSQLFVYGNGAVEEFRSVVVDGQGNVFAIVFPGVYKFSPSGNILARWS